MLIKTRIFLWKKSYLEICKINYPTLFCLIVGAGGQIKCTRQNIFKISYNRWEGDGRVLGHALIIIKGTWGFFPQKFAIWLLGTKEYSRKLCLFIMLWLCSIILVVFTSSRFFCSLCLVFMNPLPFKILMYAE